MDLCPVTFKSFVVQWSAKIADRQPQLKPLLSKLICFKCKININMFKNKIL